MDVRFWVQEHFHPVVAVSASPAAEAICINKNGLTVVDMLRPYSVLQQLNVPMRVGETSSRVMELKLRFHSAAHMHQPKTEAVDEHLRSVLLLASSRYAKAEPLEQLLASIQAGTGQDYTPWYTEYREEFLRLLAFGEHETFDHPVACIYVIPADVPDPVSHFQQLTDKGPIPPLMEKEVMCPFKDPLFPKHYVLLQDGYVGGDEAWSKAQENLAIMDRTYGANHCTLLRINTAKGDGKTLGAPPDLFRRFRRATLAGGGAGEPAQLPAEPPAGLGGRLAVQDLDAIAQLVRDFSTKTLLPKLEDRINRLNTNITASKRGLRNRLTRLLAVKPSAEVASNDTPFPHHSTESHMRQLADLAFLLRHYDFAASMYRLAAPDYLQAHSYKWYAGVEEMIGLCSLMEASEASDPVKYFTRAWENYSKCGGKLNRMLATRAMVFCATFQTSMGRHLSTNHILMRAHFEEENARAALLLEQAGYALLYLKQPSIRRFAFHMVLAGLRYQSCEQKRLALHAYRQVLSVYHERNWRFIEEHLNDILGKQCREFGDADGSLQHFMQLLKCTHRPLSLQQHYVTQFLEAVQKVELTQKDTTSPAVASLGLPLVNTRDVEVHHADQRCFGSMSAYRVEEGAWARMEQQVVALANQELANWSVKHVVNHEEFNTCVIGEDISIRVELTNPMQVKLKLTNLRLVVEFQEAQTAGKGPDADQPLSDPAQLAQQVQLSEDGITLQGGETLVTSLKVSPRVGGWLRVVGVRWLLNDAVEGRAEFNVKGRKRKKAKGPRPSQQKHYPPNRRLLFFIIPAMPRLDVSYEGTPTTLYQGELCEVRVQLSNRGTTPLRNLHFITDSTGLALDMATCRGPGGPLLGPKGPTSAALGVGGNPAALGPGNPAALGPGSSGLAGSRVLLSGKDQPQVWGHVYPFGGAGAELAPGASLALSMWLHPLGVGRENFLGVWYCEPQDDAAVMKYRTLRLCHPITVQPLLRLKPVVSPSSKDLFRYLLRLDVDSSKDGQPLQLGRLGCCTAAPGPAAAGSAATGPAAAGHAAAGPAAAGPAAAGWSEGEEATAEAAAAPWQVSVVTQGEVGVQKVDTCLQVDKTMAQGESSTLFFLLHPPPLSAAIQAQTSTPPTPKATPPPTPTAGPTTELGPIRRLRFTPSGFSPPALHFHSLGPTTTAASSSADGARMADPPLDLLLTWTLPQAGTTRQDAAAAAGSRAATTTSAPQDPLTGGASAGTRADRPAAGPAGPRTGVLHLFDVVGSQTPSPVRLLMDGQSTVKHDFRKHSMCVASITLTLRNCFASPASVMVQAGPDKAGGPSDNKHAWITLPPPSALSTAAPSHGSLETTSAKLGGESGALTSLSSQHGMPAGLAPAPEYLWCGATTVHVEGLQAGQTVQVHLQVAVFRPGAYLVADYQCRYSLTVDGKTVSRAQPGTPFLLQVQAIGPPSSARAAGPGSPQPHALPA